MLTRVNLPKHETSGIIENAIASGAVRLRNRGGKTILRLLRPDAYCADNRYRHLAVRTVDRDPLSGFWWTRRGLVLTKEQTEELY